MDHQATIFALSSAPGKAGIAVIRISGLHALKVFELFDATIPDPRSLQVRPLLSPDTREVIDYAMVVWFKSPNSFNGEDLVELHVHGAAAVIKDVLAALHGLEGFRSAQPGEFTRRAFDNNKLDLIEIEGLADLIDAETTLQRRQAIRQMEGSLGGVYEAWRQDLIRTLAYMEAVLDFPDEGDVPTGFLKDSIETIGSVTRAVTAHLEDHRQGERLRDGIRVVITGPPNVGKSSLLNYLAQREAAIVTDVAGTTRDVIEVHLDLDGCPIILVDTAGIRDSESVIEREGIKRARDQARFGDIVLWLREANALCDPNRLAEIESDSDPILVLSKKDLIKDDQSDREHGCDCAISIKTGDGMEDLLSLLTIRAKALVGTGFETVLTRTRHRDALEICRRHLMAAIGQDNLNEELVAEEIRLAVRALGRITGRVDVEAVLDLVFSDFCIGK